MRTVRAVLLCAALALTVAVLVPAPVQAWCPFLQVCLNECQHQASSQASATYRSCIRQATNPEMQDGCVELYVTIYDSLLESCQAMCVIEFCGSPQI